MKRFLLVFLASFACVSFGELTQAQMTGALLDALKQYGEYSTGYDYMIQTVPVGWQENAIYDTLRAGQSMYWGSNMNAADILVKIARMMMGERGSSEFKNMFSEILHNNLSSLQSTVSAVSNALSNLPSWIVRDDARGNFLTNCVDEIRDVITENFDLPLSDLLEELEDIEEMLHAFWQDFDALNENLQYAFNDILSSLDSNFGSMSNLFEDVESDLSRLYDVSTAIGETLEDADSLLYYIKNNTEDTATGIGAIWSLLYENLDDIIVSAYMDVLNSTPINVSVTNELFTTDYTDLLTSMDTWLYTIHGKLGEMSQYFGDLLTDTSTNVASLSETVGEWYPEALRFYGDATNYFSRMLPTSEDTSFVDFSTNAVATNYVAQVEEAEADIDAYTNALKRDDVRHELTDYLSENPYDTGSSAFETYSDKITGLLGNVDPSTTSDVILLGSNPKLPRITFDMDNLLSPLPAYRALRGMIASLWIVCGVLYKAIILGRFLSWFSKHNKS